MADSVTRGPSRRPGGGNNFQNWRPAPRFGGGGLRRPLLVVGGLAALLLGVVGYFACKVEVPSGHQAVLLRKVGRDLEMGMAMAPAYTPSRGHYKGVQPGVLLEGRYFYNPLFWSWEVRPQALIPGPSSQSPAGKIGVRIALVGEDLPAGQILAEPGQKGINRVPLGPGRYAYNWYAEKIVEHDPVTIPPGSQGVVTVLAGAEPKDPNVILVKAGERGVQKKTLPPGTYNLNPFEYRVSIVNCQSRRFKLSQDDEMSFLTSDGFVVKLDGTVEFRIMEDRVAEVFVQYNEDRNGDEIDEEIVSKIINPESRSICRINGSKLSGRKFFDGDARKKFQDDLVKNLKANCKVQGIEIVDVPISSMRPPQEIATPVRAREIAKQNLAKFLQEKEQQVSEKQLKIETMLVEQGKKLEEAKRMVGVQLTHAETEQGVAVKEAEQKLSVAKIRLDAAKDEAQAIVDKAKAEAEVIRLTNKAEVSGLAAQVQAFDGDGSALAQNILMGKLAPAFRSILSNSDGPLMELFGQFTKAAPGRHAAPPSSSVTDVKPSTPSPKPDEPRTASSSSGPDTLPADPFAKGETKP